MRYSCLRASLYSVVLLGFLHIGTNIPDLIAHEFFATCYGYDPCRACSTCGYCGHCAKRGGTCGVCKRK
jgi:hypothetical protein